jgi:hypothetical protein
MALFKLLLKGFEFPANLPPKNSNFRLVFQIRHFDSTDETWVTTEAVSPGLSTYWECDPSKENGKDKEAKYVRDGAHPRFGWVSPWDRVVVLVNSSELFQMRVVVYDVDRTDWVDILRKVGEGLLGALVGAAKSLPVVGQFAAVGTILGRVRDALVDLMAKEDTVLFAVIYEFGSDQSSQPIDLLHGGYAVRLELVTTGQTAAAARARETGAVLSAGRIDINSAFSQVPARASAATSKTGASKRAGKRPPARKSSK